MQVEGLSSLGELVNLFIAYMQTREFIWETFFSFFIFGFLFSPYFFFWLHRIKAKEL